MPREERPERTQPVQLGGAGAVLVVRLLARVRAEVGRSEVLPVVITVRHQAQSDPGGRGSTVSHPADTVIVITIVVTDVDLALPRPPLTACKQYFSERTQNINRNLQPPCICQRGLFS